MEKILIEITIILLAGILGGVLAYFVYQKRINLALQNKLQKKKLSKIFATLERTLCVGAFIGLILSSLVVGVERGYYAYIFNDFSYHVESNLVSFLDQNHSDIIKEKSRAQNEVYLTNLSTMKFTFDDDLNIVDYSFSYIVDKNGHFVNYTQSISESNMMNISDEGYCNSDEIIYKFTLEEALEITSNIDISLFPMGEHSELIAYYFEFSAPRIIDDEFLFAMTYNLDLISLDVLEFTSFEEVAPLGIGDTIEGHAMIYILRNTFVLEDETKVVANGYNYYYFLE